MNRWRGRLALGHRCPFWLFWSQNRWRFLVYLVVFLIYQGNPSISPKRISIGVAVPPIYVGLFDIPFESRKTVFLLEAPPQRTPRRRQEESRKKEDASLSKAIEEGRARARQNLDKTRRPRGCQFFGFWPGRRVKGRGVFL